MGALLTDVPRAVRQQRWVRGILAIIASARSRRSIWVAWAVPPRSSAPYPGQSGKRRKNRDSAGVLWRQTPSATLQAAEALNPCCAFPQEAHMRNYRPWLVGIGIALLAG